MCSLWQEMQRQCLLPAATRLGFGQSVIVFTCACTSLLACRIVDGLPQQKCNVECGGFTVFFAQQILQHGAVKVDRADCGLVSPAGYDQYRLIWKQRIIESSCFTPAGAVAAADSDSGSDFEMLDTPKRGQGSASSAGGRSKQSSFCTDQARSATGKRKAATMEQHRAQPITAAELQLFDQLLPKFLSKDKLHSQAMAQEWVKHITSPEELLVSVRSCGMPGSLCFSR